MNLCTYLFLSLLNAVTGSGSSQKRASKKAKLRHLDDYEEEIEAEEVLPAKTTTRTRNTGTAKAKGKQNVRTTTSGP